MSEKKQEKLMFLSGLISYIKHPVPEVDGPHKGKIVKNSYVTLDIMGGQLNFPMDFTSASTLILHQQAMFEFKMKARLLNGQHSPYMVFAPIEAKYLGDF